MPEPTFADVLEELPQPLRRSRLLRFLASATEAERARFEAGSDIPPRFGDCTPEELRAVRAWRERTDRLLDQIQADREIPRA